MKELIIVKELQDLIPPLTKEEFGLLEQSIIKEGVRDPIIIWGDMIVDGHNRYNICKKHNINFKTVDREFTDLDKVKIFIIENQLGRRNISKFVRSELILELKPLIQEKAKQKQIESGGAVPHNCAEPPIETRKELAKQANVSHETIRRVEKIKEKASEEDIQKLRRGEISINEVHKEIKRVENQTKRINEQIDRDNSFKEVPLPNRKYSVLYVDPPWQYEYSKSHSREIENNYPTMELDKIKTMDINKVVDNNCVIFMWATSPKLSEAIEVLEAWDFTYKTCAVWVKDKIGMGYYFRQQHELLLVATKGNPVLSAPTDRISSVLEYPRGKHSAKPVELYDIIDNMYPGIIKLELFSRGNDRENWMVWGYESK